MLLGCRTAGILIQQVDPLGKMTPVQGPTKQQPYLKDLLRKSESLTVIILVGQGSAE